MGSSKVPPEQRPDDEQVIEITPEYRELFTVEAGEHLDEWEQALLSLERSPEDAELLNQIFRAIHTLKGSAGFIGFDALQRLSHELESTLQAVRDGEERLTARQTELLFSGLDLSKQMVEAFNAGTSWEGDIEEFLSRLAEPAAAALPETEGADLSRPLPTGARRYRAQILIDSTEREASLRAFLLRSRLETAATILSEEPAPETITGGRLSYEVLLESDKDEETIRAAANIDQVELLALELDDGAEVEHAEETARKEAAAEDPRTETGPEATEELLAPAAQAAPRSEAQETTPHEPTSGQAATEQPTSGQATAEQPRQQRGAGGALRHEEVVRVSVERLDHLLNLVGELVVQNSNFFTLSEELTRSYGRVDAVMRLAEKTEGLAKITRDLQDGIMKVRMLPIDTVFMRFHRVVRDLARAGGKEVSFEVFGGETEIDKKVIDRIGDPLVHLIRNAVDHGLESREERRAAGKATTGTLRLGAYQDGDHICIEISDDGKGLDGPAILAKGREKGLIPADEQPPEEEVLALIFRPGFSTAKRITDVSGRGVGMDVVKQTIESLGGTVRIRSAVGRGTTVTITLPLTMAIIRAVLVEVDGINVAIPLSAVKEILKLEGEKTQTVGGRTVIHFRDEVLAIVHLRELLGMDGNGHDADDEARMPVIVVDYENRKVGLGVNRVIGTQEIVIKSLSRHYEEVEGFIGASILGDGSIALIIDSEAVVRHFYHPTGSASLRGATVGREIPVELDRRPAPFPNAEQAPSDSPFAQPTKQESAPAIVGDEGNADSEGLAMDQADETADESEEAIDQTEEMAGESEEAIDETQETTGDVEETTESAGTAEQDIPSVAEGATELLSGIGSSGALRASMALSQISGKEVRVAFPDSSIVKIAEVAELLGGDELPVAGIYIGVVGELSGGILIVIPSEQVVETERLLLGPNAAQSGDLSVIAEFGNMLSASFINAIADEVEMRLQIEPPELTQDMCLPVIDSVVARFNGAGDDILLTKATVFFGEEDEVGCSLLLFLEPDSLRHLLSLLTSEAS